MSFSATITGHWSTLLAVRGVSATITRAGVSSTATVLLARAEAEAVTNREARTEADAQDVIVRVSDYKFSNVVSAPAIGDRIVATVASVATTFEVRPSSVSEQHCRHTDETRSCWRIHTKRV